MVNRTHALCGLALVMALAGCAGPRLLREGDAHMAAKRPAEAATSYVEALRRSPKLAADPVFMAKLSRAHALAHYQAAHRLAQSAKWDDAIARFNDSLKADPTLPEAQQALGWAKQEGAKAHHKRALELADKGDLNGAIAALKQAQELDPNNLDVKDALKSIEQKKAANLSKASDLHNQALGLAARKQWGKAANALSQAIAANPNHILARVNLAEARSQLAAAEKLLAEGRRMLDDRRLERAIAAFNSALATWPAYADAAKALDSATATRQQAQTLFRTASDLAAKSKWDDAAAAAAASLAIFPYDAQAEKLFDTARASAATQHTAAGKALLADARLPDAEREFLRALDHVPAHREANDGLAQADLARGAEAERKGLWGSAQLWYRQAADRVPQPPYTTKLAEAQATVLQRVSFALTVEIRGAGGLETPASAALRTGVLGQLTRRKPDVMAIGGGAPPLFGLAAELASLTVTDQIASAEQRVHRYTIARQVPNPDIPRVQQLLGGARRDLNHLRREYDRPCPRCQRRGHVTCPTCRGTKIVRCHNCNGTGSKGGNPCPACHGTGRKQCPTCRGRGRIQCPRCKGTGRDGRVDHHDLRRKEREVRDLEYQLRNAPDYVIHQFPAEWPYTVRRHERKGIIDVGLQIRNAATGAILHSQRIQRNLPHYDTEILNANPDIGLSPDPLQLPAPDAIGAALTTAAAEAIATQAIPTVLKARAAELNAQADALARDRNPDHALEARVDTARLLQPTDPRAADALLQALQRKRQTHPRPHRTLGIEVQPTAVNGRPAARIAAVAKGSRAARAGLRIGDLITQLDRRPLPPTDLPAALAATGQIARLTLLRAGREVIVFVR